MATVSGLSGSNSIGILVDQFMEIERRPLQRLDTEKSDIQKQLAIFTDLKSELKSLQDHVSGFLTVGSEAKLSAKRTISSDSSIVTADANSNASIGVNTVFINRIASRDSLLSDSVKSSQKTIAKKFKEQTKLLSFSIGESKAVEVSVKIGDKNQTDETVLKNIAEAINEQEFGVSASVIKVTNTKVRLSIVSNETGSENSISVSATDDKFLKSLGFDFDNGERKLASKNNGGYVTFEREALDSQFSFNGVEIVNASNSIENVVDGLTLNLHKAHDENDKADTISVETDAEELKEQITTFIESYNSSLKYIAGKTSYNSVEKTRGELSGNAAVRNLTLEMREIVSSKVRTGQNKNVKKLSQMGISIERDGTLKIDDQEKFDRKIQNKPGDIRQVFAAEDIGIVVRLDNELNRFTKTGGIISDSQSGLNARITSISSREKLMEQRLRITEENLNRKYAGLQKVLSSLNTQQTLLARINSSFSGLNTGYGTTTQFGSFFGTNS